MNPLEDLLEQSAGHFQFSKSGVELRIEVLTGSQVVLMLMVWGCSLTAAPRLCGLYGVGLGQCFAICSLA